MENIHITRLAVGTVVRDKDYSDILYEIERVSEDATFGSYYRAIILNEDGTRAKDRSGHFRRRLIRNHDITEA